MIIVNFSSKVVKISQNSDNNIDHRGQAYDRNIYNYIASVGTNILHIEMCKVEKVLTTT
jgi:hypothetical protein